MDHERGDRRFPPTSHTLIEAITSPHGEERSRALDLLVTAYWRPVYTYLRLRWHLEPADAEDLTQEFFASLMEKEMFAGYDPKRARFRTYLRVCLDGFASNRHKAANRLKRGGGVSILSLDFVDAEGDLQTLEVADVSDPEAQFRLTWIRSLLAESVKQLEGEFKEKGKDRSFEVFERYDLSDLSTGDHPTYAELGQALGLPATQVNNYLAAARRRFRSIVLDRLRAVCVSDAEFQAEARDLFGRADL
ncbi:MAG TPA: sigma-70 family RNA polymerase sigma factor [Gemmatimonadales bacterium]|jgi:RNA polymerase sigma factor (sigma-70 family)|nr:sigma-70 family RNA polymerase sigma factor [Gemmatimonadales bacterium]